MRTRTADPEGQAPSTLESRPRQAPGAEIRPLTGLRGVAALWVVLFHIVASGNGPDVPGVQGVMSSGYLGVDLFFCLSGFVIAYTYRAALVPWTARANARFLALRLARIYPLYLLTIPVGGLAFMLVSGVPASGSLDATPGDRGALSLVANLLMAQAWLPGVPSWNYVAWSVSAEWLAYLAFPAIAFATSLTRSGRAIGTAACLVMASGVIALVVEGAYLNGGGGNGGLGAVLRVGFEFTLGVILFRLVEVGGLGALPFDLGAVACAALVVALTATGVLGQLTAPVTAVVALGGLVPCVALSSGPVASALGAGAMRYLGRISYSIYLLHPFVITVAVRVWRHLLGSVAWSGPGRVAFTLVAISGVTLCAALAYRLGEEPSRRAARAWIDGRSA